MMDEVIGDAGPAVDPDALRAWCREWLHAAPVSTLFVRGHLGWSSGIALDDGRQVVVKVRPWTDRVAGCVATQRWLFAAGFPCPEPLVDPTRFDAGRLATAERYVGGAGPPDGTPDPTASARLLARLITLAPPPGAVPSLTPPPAWVDWDGRRTATWPEPDDLDVDLNDDSEPAWVEDIGRGARRALAQQTAPTVVGHVDWEAHNMGWRGDEPVVVWDWDSVAALSEAAIVGVAAAVYPSSPAGDVVAATVEQTERFLDAYADARGRPWRPGDLPVLWAAGLWVLSYNAKKESRGRGAGYLAHLRSEGRVRLNRAGIT